jgi:hypothetical protein
MPDQSHQRAAEFHEQAAHAHRAAAVSHEKGDHLTGNEHSKQVMEHANTAFGMVKRRSSKIRDSMKKNP